MRERFVRTWNSVGTIGRFAAAAVIAVALIAVAVWLIVEIGYSDYARAVTGFGGKTLWDWMQVLGVPLAVALLVSFGAVVAQGVGRRAGLERELQSDRAREEALQSYLTTMKELVLDKKLGSLDQGDPAVARVAYAQTLATLRALDGVRKGFAIRFLFESQLIVGDKPIISLSQADLTNVDMKYAELKEVNLDRADMTEADLSFTVLDGSYLRNVELKNAKLTSASLLNAHLEGADMFEVNLKDAVLDGAFLINVDLSHADLTQANLRQAHMKNADLSDAVLLKADFRSADLSGAVLGRAKLTRANLKVAKLIEAEFIGAVLTDSDLSNADLTDATLENSQMATARSLVEAILPNGSKMTSAEWPRFRRRHRTLWQRAREAVRKLFRAN